MYIKPIIESRGLKHYKSPPAHQLVLNASLVDLLYMALKIAKLQTYSESKSNTNLNLNLLIVPLIGRFVLHLFCR